MEAEDPVWGEEREANEGNTFQMSHKTGAVNPTQPGAKVINFFVRKLRIFVLSYSVC